MIVRSSSLVQVMVVLDVEGLKMGNIGAHS
jgi:hypothetical protein